jgi:hypothetical protein
MFLFRRNRSRPLLHAYIATLVVLLVAVLVLHLSGTTLAVIRVVRLVVIAAIIGAWARLRRRNVRADQAAVEHCHIQLGRIAGP